MEHTIKPWFKTLWGKFILALLTVILIFAVVIGFYIYNTVKTIKRQTGIKLSGEKYDAATGDNYWLGSDKAPITIVEFGDFACPYCEESFPVIREISLKYKNDIKYIWRDYPVVQDYSALLALGGRCAGEQGRFWLMHDKLFQNQGVNTIEGLTSLANQIGADTT